MSFTQKITSVFLAALLIFTCAGCKSKKDKSADKTINYHLSSDIESLDPQIADGYASSIVVEALFEGLVRLDKNNNPAPGVAKSWDSSAGGTQYTFHLRDNAKWSNGDPVTANDFIFAFRRAVNPATGSKTNTAMLALRNAREIMTGKKDLSELGVSAPDLHTLVVHLAYPSNDFPRLTASTPFMPCQEKFFQQSSGRYGLEAKYVLGNGPFAFMNKYAWDLGEHMSLVRSSNYSGERKPAPGSLYFTIGNTEFKTHNPVQALLKKEVDVIELPTEYVDEAQSEQCPLVKFPHDITWGLCFNTQKDELKSAAIRQILVQTLPREKLLEYIPKGSEPENDIIPSHIQWDGKSYRTQAGTNFYARQNSSVTNKISSALAGIKTDSFPSITVNGIQDSHIQQMLNQMLITWNGKLNTYFNMKTLPKAELLKSVENGDFDAALCPLVPPSNSPISLLSLFLSNNPNNPAHLKSSEYDSIVNSASQQGGSKALQSFVNAEKYLNNQCVFYPLYSTTRYYAFGKKVSGIIVHPYGAGIDFIDARKTD